MVSTATWASLIPVSTRDPVVAPGETGSGISGSPQFAGGGRYVFFLSGVPDLVADDPNGGTQDLFRRDLRDGRTVLVSKATPGPAGFGAAGIYAPSFGGDRVAFEWDTDVPGLGDANRARDVYVRDLPGGNLQLVSVRADGAGAGNAGSGHPLSSADGRWIAFESSSTNLVAGADSNGAQDVFLRDLQTGRTERISLTGPGVEMEGDSELVAMNDDASVIVMKNASANPSGDAGMPTTLVVWRRGDPALRRVMVPGTPGTPLTESLDVGEAVLSSDGSRLGFGILFKFPSPPEATGIWLLNLDSWDVVPVSESLSVSASSLLFGPSMSRDGLSLAFEVTVGKPDAPETQVRIWREGLGVRTLSGWLLGDPGAGTDPASSSDPVLSPDGTALAFVSEAAIPDAGVGVAGRFRLFHRVLATGTTRRVSEDENVVAPEFDDAGTRLVFAEQEPVLIPGDHNGEPDVVVVRLADGVREVVSIVEPVLPGGTASGYSRGGLGLGADGRRLAFRSVAPDLVPGDTNASLDAFVFDRETRRTVVASMGTNGLPAGRVSEGLLCRDGRHLVFCRDGGLLTPGTENAHSQVYLWDANSGGLSLASVADGSVEPWDGNALGAVASADGRSVGFVVANRSQGPGMGRVLIRDLDAGRTWWLNDPQVQGFAMAAGTGIQLSSDGQVAFVSGLRGLGLLVKREGDQWVRVWDGVARDAVLSPDGRCLLYRRDAVDPDPGFFLRKIPDGPERKLRDATWRPNGIRCNSDGSVITYFRAEGEGGPSAGSFLQVWALRTATGDEELISRRPDGAPGSGESREPEISDDGRFIAFRSAADDLVPGDVQQQQDVFVHDRYSGITTVISRGDAGVDGNLGSTRPEISADGRYASFTTFADNLIPGDRNGTGDVVMTALDWQPAADTDGDGLPDGWERDQFGSLLRDGAEDPDGDGVNNAGEFLARTVPLDPKSNPRTVESRPIAGGVELRWAGHAGVRYRVEWTSSLRSASTWEPLAVEVTGYEGTMHQDLPGVSGGFFRIVAVSP